MPTKPSLPADLHDLIRVRGARANNLRDVTVAAESQRLINGRQRVCAGV